MSELFRLKLAGKRQVTVPARMLQALGLEEGDELRVLVDGNRIVETEACKVVPTRYFSQSMLEKLKKRKAEAATGSVPIKDGVLETEDVGEEQLVSAGMGQMVRE